MLATRRVRKLRFDHLPGYARFLLEKQLEPFSNETFSIGPEVNLTVLFPHTQKSPEEDTGATCIRSTREFLSYLAENKASEFIDLSIDRFLSNGVSATYRGDTLTDNIRLLNYVRKKAFLNLLPSFTSDLQNNNRTLAEIDTFMHELESAFHMALGELQENAHSMEKGNTVSHSIILNNRTINVPSKEEAPDDLKPAEPQNASQRQELLKSLQKSQELFKQSEALTHIGNWTWDLIDNKVTWSDELYRIYGLKPRSEEITFERFNAFIHPVDREKHLQQIQHSLQTLDSQDYFLRIVLDDGTEKVLRGKGQVIADNNGKAVKLVGTCQDITEQKRLEDSLVEKETFIRKITDTTPSIIAAYNLNTGKYIFINQALEKLLGYSTGDVLEKERGIDFFIDIIHPDDLRPIMDQNAKALEEANLPANAGKNEILEFEYRMRHKNGQYRWFRTYGTVFDRDRDNQVEHVLNISLDITEERSLRDKLKEEKTFAEMLVENSPYMVMVFDTDLKVTVWNKKCEEHNNVKKEDAIGKNILELFPEYNTDGWIAEIKKVFKGESLHLSRMKFYRKQGVGESYAIPLKNDNQEVFGLLSITRDITEIVESENKLTELNRQLNESEKNTRNLIYNAPDAVIVIDQQGKIILWNPQAEKLFGWRADEVEGTTLVENIIPLQYRNAHIEGMKRFHATGEAPLLDRSVELTALNKPGEEIDVALAVSKTKQGGNPAFIAFVRNISEKKRAEAELKESRNQLEKLYKKLEQNYEELESSYAELMRVRKQLADDRTRFIINTMPHIVASAAPDGALNYANERLMDFTGLPFDELKGWGWAKCIYFEDLDRLTSSWKHSLETGKPLHIEFRLLNTSGEPFWHLADIYPHRDEKGEITVWIATILNIHEHKMSEKTKDDFIGIASHELKTPLTSLKAYLQLLESQFSGTGNRESLLYVKKASSSVDRLHDLITELLDISKIQHDGIYYVFAEFDFNEMLAETVEFIQQTDPNHTITITGEAAALVNGDKERLRQVCINLLTNAIKYSPEADRIDVKIANDTDELLVSVTDYGIGIPKNDLERVFNRFFRVEGVGAQFQGLGIGLFISAEIIRNHIGKIWVKSEQGKGSTFHFTLPFNSVINS